MARPNLSYLKNLILFLIGLPFGALAGLTGTGPSAAAAPSIRYLLGLRDSRASAAALLTTLAASLGCLITYHQQHATPWLFSCVLTIGQILGAALGVLMVTAVPGLAKSRPAFGFLTMALGIGLMLARSHPVSLLHDDRQSVALMAIAFALGMVIGVVSRLLQMGGILTVPALVFVCGMPALLAQGIAILVLLLASVPTSLSYIGREEIEARSSFWMPFGALFGGLIGARYAAMALPSGLLGLDGLIVALFGLSAVVSPNPAVPAGKSSTDMDADESSSDL